MDVKQSPNITVRVDAMERMKAAIRHFDADGKPVLPKKDSVVPHRKIDIEVEGVNHVLTIENYSRAHTGLSCSKSIITQKALPNPATQGKDHQKGSRMTRHKRFRNSLLFFLEIVIAPVLV